MSWIVWDRSASALAGTANAFGTEEAARDWLYGLPGGKAGHASRLDPPHEFAIVDVGAVGDEASEDKAASKGRTSKKS